MSLYKEIGGYFSLETHGEKMYHENALLLNTARNALRLVIREYNINEILLPFYTCPVVWEAVYAENCSVRFYEIDKEFHIKEQYDNDSYIVVVNYFGIMDDYIAEISKTYKNLIVDNSQAFYAKPIGHIGIASFYSPRKFFGLPDGGILYTDRKIEIDFNKDNSYDRISHLLKRLCEPAENGYADFKENEKKLDGQPIMQMSDITTALMSNIDYNRVKECRTQNFLTLHSFLKDINKLKLELKSCIPMVYPLLVCDSTLREKLINDKIYIARYWQGVEENATEDSTARYFTEHIIPLPIDQRYGKDEMIYIAEKIKQYSMVT